VGQINRPTNLLDRIKRVEAELKRLVSANGLASARFRGEFEVLHATAGTWILKIGRGAQNKYFLSIRRDDGSVAFEIGTTQAGPQFWALWDRANHIVAADDADSGQGLARPWLMEPTINVLSTAIPTHGVNSWLSTQSTGQVIKQQPKMELEALLLSTGGGIGDARFIANGTPVGNPMSITSGLFAWQTIQTIALPGNYDDRVTVELQTQRTNGAGAVGGVFRCSQRQT
jgi:hypothetical protein